MRQIPFGSLSPVLLVIQLWQHKVQYRYLPASFLPSSKGKGMPLLWFQQNEMKIANETSFIQQMTLTQEASSMLQTLS